MPEISNELITRAAKGDVDAFEEIYKATSRFVYNVALRTTNNRDNASEVTQDVFLKVYNSLRNFAFRSSFKTWVYRIAVNTAINHCKARSRHERGRIEYDPAVHDTEVSGSARSGLDEAESERRMAHLLGLLDPDQRACIVLREIEGLDYRSIADTLGININTVRSRLKRARERLMKAPGKEWRP
ncbi:MAG: RNA polymerase sigma factor [Candidatus Omnitrophica bacterium]|nr:RNA polymerase sigma factor [Candidatus Omnitrophota bacterium]